MVLNQTNEILKAICVVKYKKANQLKDFPFWFCVTLMTIVVKLLYGDRPVCTSLPKDSGVDSWVHRVPENGHQPLGRGNSLWRSACPILWSNPFLLRYFTEIVPSVLPCPKTQEHQSTCVDSWVHRVPEQMGQSAIGIAAIHYRRSACPILCKLNAFLELPLFQWLIVPSVLPCPMDSGTPHRYLVWTHESIGSTQGAKIRDISH